MTLNGKIIIEGEIELLTGLHIGGSSTTSNIGGIDNAVIKLAPKNSEVEGIPFIPGSSLKGKLRSLLAKVYDSDGLKNDSQTIIEIFGSKTNTARLIISDAMLDVERFIKTFNQEEMELKWTESKWENKIDKIKGTAMDPRQTERVPAGAVFCFQMIYDVYDDNSYESHLKEITRSLRLLEDDYLGGSGTRGYGRVALKNIVIKLRTIADYYSKNEDKIEKDITKDHWKN